MNVSIAITADTPESSSLRRRGLRCIAVLVPLLVVATLGGCSRLRLPAVDPTGSCLFQPLPTTTSLALPCTNGEGCQCMRCITGIGDCLGNCPLFQTPNPAFETPVDPPDCLEPAPAGVAASDEPCVPGPGCSGSCATGPPAVLLGAEIDSDPATLPQRGQRGCILLTPQKIIAPVGGEVILMSGICGTDGYLQMGQPLEWMLSPESVGQFIDVGDDDPGLLHKLAGIKTSEKKDPGFARGVTSTKAALITRGNLDPRDDVKLEKGQTWLSINSPTEGVSRVTVLAPESDCWDQRKATATIYWIDAVVQFPATQIVPAGSPVSLTTRVMRSENNIPAKGWRVRYQLRQGDLARFGGTEGSDVVEVEVDENGNATAELLPIEGTSGTADIDISVIRPGGQTDNMPTLTLRRGQTRVTWSSPQLRVEAFGPEVAGYEQPYVVKAIVSNPGDQPVTDVQITLNKPDGVVLGTQDQFAVVTPGQIVWNVPRIEPQTELEILADVTARNSNILTFVARGEPGLASQAAVRTNVYQPSLSIEVRPRQDRVKVGKTAVFDVLVRNTGDRPLSNVLLRAEGDQAMTHLQTQERVGESPREEGPLQAGGTWESMVEYVPSEPGQRCITVQVTADGGQRDVAESCIIAINPVPPTPAMSVTLESNESFTVGETRFFNGRVTNTGQVPLEDVRAVMVFDPQLQLQQATRGADQSRLGEYLVSWAIGRMEPGQSVLLQGQFLVIAPSDRCQVIFTAESDQGARGEDSRIVRIAAGANAGPPESPSDRPGLPPTVPNTNPPAAGNPQAGGPLQLNVQQREISPRANLPIPYTVTITNNTTAVESDVTLDIIVPAGVRVESIYPTQNPSANQFTRFGDRVSPEPIRSLLAGESLQYQLTVTSTIPQDFQLVVEATSNRPSAATRAFAQTRVTQ
ncbi:hypothetical protein [Crateriforma conspicua]|uniref:Large cysteine-rich periplasmic protein OmcB n=1 Tax=Crateriforma conspicua TaxID=2527996 RepID=A0A5C6FKI9_9PLAN|nr:hypothetical protein [Crateriforma conspicua]TWU62805.1 hypothetical protein V7x_45410 [Crateriforma conspicua]